VQGKRILLIVGGGIAAYKSLELVRRLKERGASVRAILTKGGAEFVTPLSLSVLTEEKALTDLFDLKDEAEIGHIRLSREAELIVVAPATADLLARMAHGLADDLATAVLLATDKPVLAAPAMNVRMWEHAATQRNLAALRADGIEFVGPIEGEMACGEFGPGRMAEPAAILDAIAGLREKTAPRASVTPLRTLAGWHVLITSGPTHEPIDPVRYIANRSSGKQGHAIAEAAAKAGANVTLVSGPVNVPDPRGVNIVKVESARDMLAAVEAALPADVAVFAAAVADWRTATNSREKIKKSGKLAPELSLVENPDILSTVAHLRTNRPRLVIGFAAETEHVVEHAKQKLVRKACDWILANDVSPETGIMGGDSNTIHLVTRDGVENWPPQSKNEVAAALIQRIVAAMDEKK
jgi:phosphopantothenoylcysteine decarboxylase/phosphopantothenate--cysteine ligase